MLVEAICTQLPRDVPVIVHGDPSEKLAGLEQWLGPFLPEAKFTAQCAGDLGARLEHAFKHAFSSGYERVAVIGSDCVEIPPALFTAAFSTLDEHDAAIGPSADGGYYLLALKTPQPALFENIAWSTAQTLADTLERAQTAGLSPVLLPELRDVDTESDWKIAECFLNSKPARERTKPT